MNRFQGKSLKGYHLQGPPVNFLMLMILMEISTRTNGGMLTQNVEERGGPIGYRSDADEPYDNRRFLHIVLYMAERAWSHAMEKRQLPDGPNARQCIYLLGRLRKAVKWAALFCQLCAVKGDSRTSLEAEAYACYMKGTLLFEQDQNWKAALMNFKKARDVYDELRKYGNVENQVLCRARVEELEPSIRYCLHKVGESSLQTSELLDIGEMEGPALDLFKTKLEVVMAEARSQQAASMTEFYWLGHRFPISNAKTRVSILKARELEKDLHGSPAESLPAEKKLAIFEKVFSAYQDARSCIRNDLNSIDLSDLVSSGRDSNPEEVAFAEEYLLKCLVFRAERCFYLAKSYSAAGKRTEAYALFCHARSLADAAIQKLHMSNNPEKVPINDLKELSDNCRSSSCIEHASGIMEEEKIPEKLSKGVSTMSLTGREKKEEKFLQDMLDVYESAVGDPGSKVIPRIEHFPPPFQAVPCNPIVLDIAYNSIEFPSLENRIKKDKKGIFSRLWR